MYPVIIIGHSGKYQLSLNTRGWCYLLHKVHRISICFNVSLDVRQQNCDHRKMLKTDNISCFTFPSLNTFWFICTNMTVYAYVTVWRRQHVFLMCAFACACVACFCLAKEISQQWTTICNVFLLSGQSQRIIWIPNIGNVDASFYSHTYRHSGTLSLMLTSRC